MYKKVCITNRHLTDDLLRQIRRAAAAGADMIVLREKDLNEDEYRRLAGEVMGVCEDAGVLCVLHTYWRVAGELGCPNIHLTMAGARELPNDVWGHFACVGVSTHSVVEAMECEKLGATYVTASPIFHTQCKPDAAPRGLDYLSQVAGSVKIPVYALGGIHPDNIDTCIEAGASGVCMMSEYMILGEDEWKDTSDK